MNDCSTGGEQDKTITSLLTANVPTAENHKQRAYLQAITTKTHDDNVSSFVCWKQGITTALKHYKNVINCNTEICTTFYQTRNSIPD